MDRSHYITIGKLFKYPGKEYKQDIENCMLLFRDKYPKAAIDFQRFYDYVQAHTLFEIEEVFGVTFHIQAICFLDIGYVLFGEDYKRGEFLVNMKKEQAKINHDCGEELPDNLTHILALMTISKEEDFVKELAVRVMTPALEKMLNEFDEARMALRNKLLRKKHKVLIMEDINHGNIFQNALMALHTVLKTDYEGINYNDEVIEQSLSNFIPNCGPCSTETNNEPLKTIEL